MGGMLSWDPAIIELDAHHKAFGKGLAKGEEGGIGDLMFYSRRRTEYTFFEKGKGHGFGNGYTSGNGLGNARTKSWG